MLQKKKKRKKKHVRERKTSRVKAVYRGGRRQRRGCCSERMNQEGSGEIRLGFFYM